MFHRIHLKGPWECAWLAPEGRHVSAKVTMPANWSTIAGDSAGKLRLDRWFHRPTNIDDVEVVLVVPGLVGTGKVLLNEALLATVDQQVPAMIAASIGEKLLSRNRLTIELTWSPVGGMEGGLPEAVYLEMRPRQGGVKPSQ